MVEPKIIYENPDFVIIDKPAGLQVHPAKIASKKFKEEKTDSMLTDWLLKKFPEIKNVGDDPINRPGIVHRLDKETSGLMVIPRNQKTFEYLKSLFQNREIKKSYTALVEGTLTEREGVIDKPIGMKAGTLKRSVHAKTMVKGAVTEYKVEKVIERDGKPYSLLTVNPKTGRTHQIRVHLKSIGHPIVGDAMYGSKNQPPWVTRLMLHAKTLAFSDGRGGMFEFESQLPTEFE